MGGNDLPTNIVKLTAREHFIAHWLLWRIHKNHSMAYAFFLMAKSISIKNKPIFSSIAYHEAKIEKGKAVSELNRKIKKGHIKSQETLDKMSLALKNRPFSEEHKQNIKLSLLNKPKSEEHKLNLSKSLQGFDWSLYKDRNKSISNANSGKGNGRSVKVFQMINNEIINVFDTKNEAYEYVSTLLSISKSKFYRNIKNNNEVANFKWKIDEKT